jgi:hypothetical protein
VSHVRAVVLWPSARRGSVGVLRVFPFLVSSFLFSSCRSLLLGARARGGSSIRTARRGQAPQGRGSWKGGPGGNQLGKVDSREAELS